MHRGQASIGRTIARCPEHRRPSVPTFPAPASRCSSIRLRGNTHSYRRRFDLDAQPLDRRSITTIELVGHLVAEANVECAPARRLHERRLFRPPRRTGLGGPFGAGANVDCPPARRRHDRRLSPPPRRSTSERARPLPDPFGSDHAELETTIIGTSVFERSDAAEDLSDVADQHAARLAGKPLLAVDADLNLRAG